MECLRRALFLCAVAVLVSHACCKRPPKPGKRVRDEPVADQEELIDESTISAQLEHSIAGGPFSKRGAVFVRGLQSSRPVLTLRQDPLSPGTLAALTTACGNNSVYVLRTRALFCEGSSPPESSQYVQTAISACSLCSSGLSDMLTITADGAGAIIGLSLTPVTATPPSCDADSAVPSMFNTTAVLDNGAPPPSPDIQGYHEKLEREQQAKKDGVDNRSFLQKYWMYILIAFLGFSLINGLGGAAGGGG